MLGPALDLLVALQVTRAAIGNDCTLLCGWSSQECARYLETLKRCVAGWYFVMHARCMWPVRLWKVAAGLIEFLTLLTLRFQI